MNKQTLVSIGLVVVALIFVVSAPFALPALPAAAAPHAASTATAKPTRTPRPTKTPKVKATVAPKTTRDPNAKLNPEASFAASQKDPCALVTQADLEKIIGTKAGKGAPFDVANGRGCEYNTSAGLVAIAVERDDKGRLLTQTLASHVISGCTRDKVPSEADRAPFLTKPLAEKWRMQIVEDNKCGSKYAPVAEFGPDAYANNGILRIVIGKHMLSAEVPGSTEKAIALTRLAFVR